MDWYWVLLIQFGALIGLFLAGVPIFIAFLVIVLCGTGLLMGVAGYSIIPNSIYATLTSSALTSIPIFVLMGEILFRSGSMDILFDSVDRIVGQVRGRQYVLVTLLGAIFGALSGVAMAVAAMLGRSVMPGMVERGYDQRLSAGLILAGASLAPIIPPSLLAIIIGSLANVSIAKLLVAGILPGIMMCAILLTYVYVRIRLNPALAPQTEQSAESTALATSRRKAALRLLPLLTVIFFVMGVIMLGIATPSESAATGVLGALITAGIYKKLSFAMVREALLSTVGISTMILIIMAVSKMFTEMLAYTGATSEFVRLIGDLDLSNLTLLIAMMLVPFVLCIFIDTIAVVLISIPVYQPLISHAGFDPVWFWLLFLINITLGAITPPFGYTLFAFKATVPNMPLHHVFQAVIPFVLLFAAAIALLIAFPIIVTFIPSLI